MDILTIFNRILVRSGQFLMRVDYIELDETRFRVLVEDALAVYNKYHPLDSKFNIDTSSRIYTFTGFEHEYGVPDDIVSATPTRILGTYPYYMRQAMSRSTNEYLEEKELVPVEFRYPKLHLCAAGSYEVHGMWFYKVTEENATDGKIIIKVDHITINETEFFNLLQGLFLQSLGRSRRAFTLNDLPITMDADQIASEGEAMVEKSMENLVDAQSKFYLAYGG